MNPDIPQLQRRIIEARIILDIYNTGLKETSKEQILGIITGATENSAIEAGREFALAAPGQKPCLKHFATVLDRWEQGGALDIGQIEFTETTLNFKVTRCGYHQAYRKLGLPDELCYAVSCCRDGSFARGYHQGLTLDRPQTIAQGAPECVFKFTWGK